MLSVDAKYILLDRDEPKERFPAWSGLRPESAHMTSAVGSFGDVFVTDEKSRGITRCFANEDEYTAATFRERP